MKKIICNKKYDIDLSNIPDLFEFILKKAGVKDTRRFKNPTRASIHDPMLFKDMDKAIGIIKDIIKEGKVGVVVDPDADGLTSGSMIINFLKDNYNTEYEYFLSYNKSHQLTDKNGNKRLQEVKNSECKYIIIPDACSSDIGSCKELHKLGKIILILDHHKYNSEDIRKYATVVNCTDGSYPNINLSGATVVQKLIDALYEEGSFGLSKQARDKYLDLCALGTIADSIDLRDPEARYYALEGLKPEHEINECIKEICLRSEYEMRLGKSIKTIGFNIAPCVNSVTRYGNLANEKKNTQSELEMLFRALINEEEVIEYQPRRKCKDDPKPEIEFHSLQKTAARLASNARGRQSKAVSNLVDKLIDLVDTEAKIVLVDATELLIDQDNNATGLIANKLMSHFGKPAFVLNGSGGSGRSNAIGRLTNAHEYFNNTNLIKVEGHERAFGIKELLDKKAFLEFCNKDILETELLAAKEVDFEIQPDRIRQKDINEIGRYLSAFGSTVPAPTFFIPGIEILNTDIKGVAKEDTDYINSFSFKYNNIEFNKSYCKKEDFDEITCKPKTGFGKPKPQKLKIDVICEVYNKLTEEGDIVSSLRINEFYSESLGFVKEEDNELKKDNTEKETLKKNKRNVPFVF